MEVSLSLSSLDGSLSTQLSAQTMDRVTGNYSAVNWNKFGSEWPHLQHLIFPSLGKREQVDVLIGLDHPELHVCRGEVNGLPGEPIARLTPLGWTCVGPVERSTASVTMHAVDSQHCFTSLQCAEAVDSNSTTWCGRSGRLTPCPDRVDQS